jgi:hypothetical protein
LLTERTLTRLFWRALPAMAGNSHPAPFVGCVESAATRRFRPERSPTKEVAAVRILALLAIATLVTGACETSGISGTRRTAAQGCAESGGIWRPAIEFCEQASGGGGGY